MVNRDGSAKIFAATSPALGAIFSLSTDVIHVEDYGAVGDGSTDNSAAISNAVTACVFAGGCTLHFGSSTGNQFVMQGVQIVGNSVRMVCEGGVTLINKSANSYAIQFGDGTTQYNSDGITGCTFGQLMSVVAGPGNVALKLNNLLQMNVQNVTIKNYPSAPYDALIAYNINQTTIDKLYVAGAKNNGIQITSSGSPNGGDIFLSNVQSNSNGMDGLNFGDDGGIYADNVTAFGNGRYGWNLYKISFGNVNLFFSNCVGDTSGSYNWSITSLNNGQFSNAWGSTQLQTSVNAFAAGFFFAGPDVKNIVMTNPVASYNNSHGIMIFNAGGMPQHISIVNPIAGSSTNGNGRSGAGNGIWIDNYPTDISIIGGMALSNTSGAIHTGTVPTVYISNVQGYAPAPVSCSGVPSATFTVDRGVVTHC